MCNHRSIQSATAAMSRGLIDEPASNSGTTSPSAKPFIKWAGGKRSMLPLLLPLVPASLGTYHEPFVGGGALFWTLSPPRAFLGDSNPDLVNGYAVVRDDVDGLVAALAKHHYDKAHYLQVRALDPRTLSPTDRAARFIFLNRTCFNGLYRVNGSGRFNVPFGRYKNPVICDAANLRACSAGLAHAEVHREPFETVLSRAVAGDFVYFDPPYLPISATSSFTGYTEDGFGLADHERLRDVARELKARGVRVLLSHSAAPAIVDLYSRDFQIIRVQAGRAINAKGDRRGKLEELIIR